MTRPLASFAAAVVVMFLALGPFASPVEDEVGAAATAVDHRNDIPVIRPGRASTVVTAIQASASRAALLVTLVTGLFLAVVAVRRRGRTEVDEPGEPPLWSCPPRRGPPLLLPG